MKLQEGTHEVTCKECGASGTVRIRNRLGKVRVDDDSVTHSETCPHYKRPQPTHLQRRRWVKEERDANAMVGAFATPASGAVGEDGDGRLFHQWRVEVKGTNGPFYTLTQAVWSKLVSGALLAGEEPLLFVSIFASSPAQKETLVVMRKEFYESRSEEIPAENSGRKILATVNPYYMMLNPVGVVVSKVQFELMMESGECP